MKCEINRLINVQRNCGCHYSSVDSSTPTILACPPGSSPKHAIYAFIIYNTFAIFVVLEE